MSDFDQWVADAQSADILAVAQRLSGNALKKAGKDYVGQCPHCRQSNTSFIITPGNEAKKQFLCRPGGLAGGVIKMVMHCLGMQDAKGKNFIRVCEEINGYPPPEGESQRRERDPEAVREERKDSREDAWAREMAEAERGEWKVKQCVQLFNSALPFQGSGAEEYLKGRGIRLQAEQSQDLRFIKSLAYWGYPDDHRDAPLVHLMDAGCMVAAIRNVSGQIIGAHRTYIDFKDFRKLRPPGDKDRNRAKKISGEPKGGMISLGAWRPAMAIGEGIETTCSWYSLGVGPDEVGIAAAVSVYNMAGGATEQVKPVLPSQRKAIPNGIPNMDAPGMRLPPEVEHVILLGDGDSDREWTRQMLLTAGERLARDEIKVEYHWAPDGMDFNDLALQMRRAA
jgi:hypothetical protein